MIMQAEQHPIDKQIGERIRKRRLMCGFSQRDLGKKLGISFQHIQGYETGEVRLVVDRLYNLAEALSVDMSYFFTKTSEDLHDKAFHYSSSGIGSEEISRLVREYRKIKDEALRDIVHLVIKALANTGFKGDVKCTSISE